MTADHVYFESIYFNLSMASLIENISLTKQPDKWSTGILLIVGV